jgi:hypothetical protein
LKLAEIESGDEADEIAAHVGVLERSATRQRTHLLVEVGVGQEGFGTRQTQRKLINLMINLIQLKVD